MGLLQLSLSNRSTQLLISLEDIRPFPKAAERRGQLKAESEEDI